MCPVTKTFSINTLVAAIISIAAELSTPAPLKAIFRSLTILPGALMMKRTDWVPPPPAKQSIVTDLVIVGEENSPTPAQLTVPPSATLFNAPAKLRQAGPAEQRDRSVDRKRSEHLVARLPSPLAGCWRAKVPRGWSSYALARVSPYRQAISLRARS